MDYRRVHFARGRYPGFAFSVADATELPISTNSIDVVLACGLLHHLSDDMCRRLMEECERVAKPRGRLLVIEPALKGGSSLLDRAMVKIDLGDHLRTLCETLAIIAPRFKKLHHKMLFQPPLYRCAFVAAEKPDAVFNP